MKKKYKIEYTINSSPKVLYDRISSAWGLSEWFADNVTVLNSVFTFNWEGDEAKAIIIAEKDQKYVRYQWIDDENEDKDKAEECFFEFKINIDELTKDVALEITDFAEEDEIDDAIDLWNTQIERLKNTLGSQI